MVGHRLVGTSLLHMGDIAEGRAHLDRAIALYDPMEHRLLATRFGQDVRVAILSWRSLALWVLGYPEAACADAEHALKDAREMGQAATLMYALTITTFTQLNCGNYDLVKAQGDESSALADEKRAVFWKLAGTPIEGLLLCLAGKPQDALHALTTGIAAWQSTGSRSYMPLYLSYLAVVHAQLDQFDDAWRCVGEALAAVEKTNERWNEADVHRVAGEIALLEPKPDAGKAEAYFNRALDIARKQQAKSWELRAAMSMARLWRDQGKPQQARQLLAPVYGWFTEGFDMLDLKEAKTLLDELHA